MASVVTTVSCMGEGLQWEKGGKHRNTPLNLGTWYYTEPLKSVRGHATHIDGIVLNVINLESRLTTPLVVLETSLVRVRYLQTLVNVWSTYYYVTQGSIFAFSTICCLCKHYRKMHALSPPAPLMITWSSVQGFPHTSEKQAAHIRQMAFSSIWTC